MADTNLIDELHLTVRVPDDLPEDRVETVRRALSSDEFMERLWRAVGDSLRAYPELHVVSFSLAR